LDLDRRVCREHVQRFFSVTRMVDEYEAAYRQILEAKVAQNGRVHSGTLTLS
jgi:hypothetical protein